MAEDAYFDEDGFVRMCRQCKKVRDVTDEWVLYTNWYVKPPEELVWEVCPTCMEAEG